MERLTEKRESGAWPKKIWSSRTIAERLDRLAAYEETGLEPEEISKIREDVENGYLKSTARRYGVSVDRLRELAQADREGRVEIIEPDVYECIKVVRKAQAALRREQK